ncbi:sodium-driven chloride bicarbonate exchanger-like isoform X2 [Gigantopelta aegis]|uniref:sodium-driven chloride bicarbonate exchanger-like isoform X2 n=1 Tax=Gigantopelta aegis TaxID=1735272 RepID=UPI001B88A768|nr:sodium-driven chloride bicarbonate exchanger-like isoform X2 [Gigantopelta aegis]
MGTPNRVAEIKADAASVPIRDMGSFVSHPYPSEADLQDHRKQGGADAVFIGLQLPRRRHRRRRHHKHHRKDTASDDITDATPPSERIQYILEDEDDELHRAHDMFCEMTELMGSGNTDEVQWKETARWIKFEEDVEEGGERWSKPHVATLSLHSLFELRCSIMTGTVILDMDAYNLDQVTDMVLDNMIASKQLEDTLRDQVKATIMCRHKHQNEKRHRRDDSKMHLPIIRSLADIGKKYSEPKHLSLHGDSQSHSQIGAKSTPNMQQLLGAGQHLTTDSSASVSQTPSSADIVESALHKNLHFMKKIRPGSEASNIMVGEVDYLNHQIVAFVRLTQAVLLGDLTEVPVPTRFLFILLGPVGNQNKFHELGRSIGTLMSDEIFHDVAYHARNREDLLAGIDEFLDQVTVLPPGEWDPSIRIEPPKSVPSQESRKMKSSKPPLPNGKVVIEEEVDEHSDPTLQRTGRIFGGLRDDIRRKLPFWLSDFKDALHVQCIASFVFLYFACLTPIITFGGLLGDATNNNMAAMESILAGSICGVTYALFAGQPLTILGSTGPVLVFEKILHSFCIDNDWDYLQLRLWIGVWTGIFLMLIVAFDLSALVRYITRFTEESFAALISLIFIYEAFIKLGHILDYAPINFSPNQPINYECFCGPSNSTLAGNDTVNVSMAVTQPLVAYTIAMNTTTNVTNITNWSAVPKEDCVEMGGELFGAGCDTVKYVPDVFLLSVLLFLGTFTLAMVLKSARSASFFPTLVRSMVSDFAVIIAILLMIVADILIGLGTPKLMVPAEFSPTIPDRGWVVNPLGRNPWWLIIAAIIPALLLMILIFMDQQITCVIINRKENKLVKGHGYHLDLFLVTILIVINSFLGLPWFVAATVLSINHVNSLKKESQCSAPGERPKFLGVREQRVTGICIFLFIGVSVLLTSVLKYIPMPVLYGVFLYMGVSSLNGMQLVDRILIVLMPRKYQPDLMYLRHVRTKKVHLFTFIQVFCLAVLWIVKTVKKISIAFPLMVLTMCFIRKFMERIFTQHELKWLDDIMPESHKRAKADEETDDEGEEMVEGVLLDPGVIAVPIHVESNPDMVNISEQMLKSGMWKTIIANDSSSNLINEEQRSSSRRKKKSKKQKNDGNAMPTIPASPHEENSEEEHDDTQRSPSKKKGQPVRFYIDDEEKEEKESLIKAPEIVVDPPSDVSRLNSPSGDDESKV